MYICDRVVSYLSREVKATKPALEATSLLRAWNCSSSLSFGSVVWSPSFISRAVSAPLISFSLFSANIPCRREIWSCDSHIGGHMTVLQEVM